MAIAHGPSILLLLLLAHGIPGDPVAGAFSIGPGLKDLDASSIGPGVGLSGETQTSASTMARRVGWTERRLREGRER